MGAHLVVESGPNAGYSFSVIAGKVRVVGSHPSADICLQDPSLLPKHAALMLNEQGLSVVDLGGPAGTFINGARLVPRHPTPARPGDALKVGDVLISISAAGTQHVALACVAEPAEEEVIPAAEYEVVRLLGEGGMGKVYAARRRSDGVTVAIKVLDGSVVPGSPTFKRFRLEGEIGKKIVSPYVVRVYDSGASPSGRPYIVMEYVEGCSAADRLKELGAFSPVDVVRIGSHVAQALAAALAVGVIHRDVKPANILLPPQGYAKLTDFGIAKELESSDSVTASGTGLGTLAYMAPEQVSEAKHADASADLYSLGATLYHLLSGKIAFNIRSVRDLVAAEDKELPAISYIPADLDALVHDLMAKQPWERPASAALVAGRLEAIRTQHFPGTPA